MPVTLIMISSMMIVGVPSYVNRYILECIHTYIGGSRSHLILVIYEEFLKTRGTGGVRCVYRIYGRQGTETSRSDHSSNMVRCGGARLITVDLYGRVVPLDH